MIDFWAQTRTNEIEKKLKELTKKNGALSLTVMILGQRVTKLEQMASKAGWFFDGQS